MRYIPPHQRDTRYPLWCINYSCRIPYNQLRSIEEIETLGMPATHDGKIDYEAATELRDIQIPVERMAELYDQGARILIREPEKHARTIYSDIMAHLTAWRSKMVFTFNEREIPRDDLRMFDNLAQAIYPFAQSTMPLNYSNGGFAELVRKLGGVDRRALHAQLFENSVKKQEDTTRNTERARMSDFFAPR